MKTKLIIEQDDRQLAGVCVTEVPIVPGEATASTLQPCNASTLETALLVKMAMDNTSLAFKFLEAGLIDNAIAHLDKAINELRQIQSIRETGVLPDPTQNS